MKWKRVRGHIAGAYQSVLEPSDRGVAGEDGPFRLEPQEHERYGQEWNIVVAGQWIGLRRTLEEAKRDCEEFYASHQ